VITGTAPAAAAEACFRPSLKFDGDSSSQHASVHCSYIQPSCTTSTCFLAFLIVILKPIDDLPSSLGRADEILSHRRASAAKLNVQYGY
jgi:hypothetical protein